MSGNSLNLDLTYVQVFDGVITQITIPHNLSVVPTTVIIESSNTTDPNLLDYTLNFTSNNNIVVNFSTAPAAGTVKFSVIVGKSGRVIPPPNFHPLLAAYMTLQGIANDATLHFTGGTQKTGSQIWTAVNTFLKNMNGYGPNNGTWNHFLRFGANGFLRPGIGDSDVKVGINIIDPGTLDAIFHGSWTFNGKNSPDGSTGYADARWCPGTIDMNKICVGIYSGSTDASANAAFGIWTGNVNECVAAYQASGLSFLTAADLGSGHSCGDTFRAGLSVIVRNGDGYTKGYRCGRVAVSGLQTPFTSFTRNVNIAALEHETLTRSLFSTSDYCGDFLMDEATGITDLEVDNVNKIWEELQEALGRSYIKKRATWEGDSIMAGTLASKVTCFANQVCDAKGWTMINRGLDGRCLQKSGGPNQDRLSSPNVYDDRLNFFPFDPKLDILFAIECCVNDTGFHYVGEYSSSLYATQLGAIVDHLTGPLGWPTANILLMGGTPVDDTGSPTGWTYYISLGAAASTETDYAAYKTATGTVATAKGVLYRDPSVNVAYTGADKRHIDSTGHTNVKNDLMGTIASL